jgi:hypothetical protein
LKPFEFTPNDIGNLELTGIPPNATTAPDKSIAITMFTVFMANIITKPHRFAKCRQPIVHMQKRKRKQ